MPHLFIDLDHLTEDIIDAECEDVPGFVRHQWVIARQIQRHAESPPPVWISLVMTLLDKLIPLLLDYLKKKYGDKWPAAARDALLNKALPWRRDQDKDHT